MQSTDRKGAFTRATLVRCASCGPVSVCLCHKSVSYRNVRTDRAVFCADAFSDLPYTGNSDVYKVSVLSPGILSQTLDLENVAMHET